MEAQKERKQHDVNLDSNSENAWICETYNNLCCSPIGLISHKRIYQASNQNSYIYTMIQRINACLQLQNAIYVALGGACPKTVSFPQAKQHIIMLAIVVLRI